MRAVTLIKSTKKNMTGSSDRRAHLWPVNQDSSGSPSGGGAAPRLAHLQCVDSFLMTPLWKNIIHIDFGDPGCECFHC